MNFHDSVKKFFFAKQQNEMILALKLLDKHLEDSVVIFKALKTTPTSLTSAASATSLASTASKAQFFQKNLPDTDALTITGTKITNTGDLLWNRS